MKGGNTDQLYIGNGRHSMAESLAFQHPDIVKISRKWGRYQHHVDYSPFKINKLIKRKGIKISDDDDDYGMILNENIEENIKNGKIKKSKKRSSEAIK